MPRSWTESVGRCREVVLIVSDHFEIRFFLASAPFYCGFCGCSFGSEKKHGLFNWEGTGFVISAKGKGQKQKVQRMRGGDHSA